MQNQRGHQRTQSEQWEPTGFRWDQVRKKASPIPLQVLAPPKSVQIQSRRDDLHLVSLAAMPDATHAGSHAPDETGYLSACEHVPVKVLVCLCHSLLGFRLLQHFSQTSSRISRQLLTQIGWFQHQCPCSIGATDLRTKRALVTSSTLDSVHLDQFSSCMVRSSTVLHTVVHARRLCHVEAARCRSSMQNCR